MKPADPMNWIRKLLGAPRVGVPTASAADDEPSLPAGTMLVNARSTGEFDARHIEGAVLLPLDRIHVDIAKGVPDQKTPIVLYCRSGARSGRACTVAWQLGYSNVRNGGGIANVARSSKRPVSTRTR